MQEKHSSDGSQEGMEGTLDPEDDPQKRSKFRRWLCVIIISSACTCVTCASSVAAQTELASAEEFNTSQEVMILGISLFVLGLGLGPFLTGPLSEMYGRRPIYSASMSLFFLFGWPVAFANNVVVFLIFRFITGFCGSALFSVAGGSVGDLFPNDEVAAPMAVYTASPFLGPVLGPALSGFIVQNSNWRWVYRVLQIWSFVELALLLFLVPETFVQVILKQKARRLRDSGDGVAWAPLDKPSQNLASVIWRSCCTPFKILISERMALLLDIWTALLLGILYLTFQAFPIIFGQQHGFNQQEVGLSFIGLGVGVLCAVATQPIWNAVYRRQIVEYGGHPPPESRLIMGMVGAVLVPVGLFWLAFTTYGSVHWVVPIIACIPFAMGVLFVFTSVFTFLVTTYRPVAASAMAGNSALRSTFAAIFPLVTSYMYERLGTVGATAMLAGFTTIMAPLPFIFYKYGPSIRKSSKFAVDP